MEKTIHQQHKHFSVDDEFEYFDEGGDQVFMDDEKLVVVSDNRHQLQRNDDTLKQIFETEFSPRNNYNEPPKPMQKPPRKSIDSLNSKKTASNYSSRHSMRLED